MNVPPFPLPSQMSKVIHFRVPNVDDGLEFCELEESQEEENTTQYLNHMQDANKGDFSDSSTWTGEDRRTALWWIFIATSADRTIPFSYDCLECGEKHYRDLKMDELFETATALKSLPKLNVKFTVKGQPYEADVHPLTGRAVESIEMLRNQRDWIPEQDKKERKKATNLIAINETAHALTFAQQPEDYDEAHEWKVNLIKSMHLNTEFPRLTALVEQELRKARHGLLSQYNEGRYFLVANVQECTRVIEKGGKATRMLLLPFLSNDFIATF